jgi:hypothetical protein
MLAIRRLTQYLLINYHNGVRAQRRALGLQGKTRRSLLLCQSLYMLFGFFAGQEGLVNIHRQQDIGHLYLLQ